MPHIPLHLVMKKSNNGKLIMLLNLSLGSLPGGPVLKPVLLPLIGKITVLSSEICSNSPMLRLKELTLLKMVSVPLPA